MKTRYLSFALALLCTFASCFIKLSAQIAPQLADTLQKKLDTLRVIYQLKGISAAVFIPNQGMWRGVSGVSHGATDIDPTMLFSIGSITKSFTAAEILKLVEEGKLSLADTVGKYIPPHPFIKPNITIRQLLNHTAGLGDVTNAAFNNALFANLNKRWDAQTVIDSFLTAPVWLPGVGFKYSNAGYMLLGIIAEDIEGDSLHKIVRNRFLSPLGLNDTYMHMYDPFTYPIPHNWSTPSLNPALAQDVSAYPHTALWTSAQADGGLFSSAGDLAYWGYALYTGQVIDTASLRLMTTFVPIGGSYFNGYGLGCMRFPYNGKVFIGHAGNYFGFAASMLFHQKDSICVGMLINQDCISPKIAEPFFSTVIQNFNMTAVRAIEDAAKEMEVYPNPASDKIVISSAAKNIAQAGLYDMSGRQLIRNVGSSGTLDVADMSPGIYLLLVELSDGRKFARKIVVNH